MNLEDCHNSLKDEKCEPSGPDHVKILKRTFALLKAIKINLLYLKKAIGQVLRSAKVQKSTRDF